MAHPIWKDYIISVSNTDSVVFDIAYNNRTIYGGRAYRVPGASSIEIKINDICASYLQATFPATFPNTGSTPQQFVFDFTITITKADNTTTTYTVSFSYDWSYDYEINHTEPILSAPIIRKIPKNAPIVYSTRSATTYIEYRTPKGSYSLAFDSAFEKGEEYQTVNGVGVAVNVFNFPNIADEYSIIRIHADEQTIEYKRVGACYRYMLYYTNAYGGWDFLAIEGKSLMTDNYTRHTIGQSYNNVQSRNRGSRNYRNDIERKWLLRTLWIDDAGAQNMHHLLGSTEVYLYDMQTEQLYPITLDNPQCEYKTYSNNGNQLVRFDIEATLAQNLTRR